MEIINFLIYLAIMIGIYGILALTLNFQYGFGGMVNFGHVAFFCMGAYASTLLVMWGAPFLVGVLGAFISAGVFAFLISTVTKSLKADYWAITTIAFAEIVRLFFVNEAWIYGDEYTAGPFGIPGIPRPLESFFSTDAYPFFYLLIVLIFLGITYFVLRAVTNSPFGRVMKAVREDEELPMALGKNVPQFKIKIMVIGGAFAGVAGSLIAHYTSFVAPSYFMPIETFIVWAMIIIGGRGNHRGAIVGTIIVQLFYNSTRFIKDYVPIDAQLLASLRMIAIGSLIVLVMLFRQEGLIKEKKKVYELLGRNSDVGS